MSHGRRPILTLAIIALLVGLLGIILLSLSFSVWIGTGVRAPRAQADQVVDPS